MFDDDHPHEECGVIGVFGPNEDVARMAFFGLTRFSIVDRRQRESLLQMDRPYPCTRVWVWFRKCSRRSRWQS